MRRSVWILAMCGFAGLSFQEVRSQEAFGPASPVESQKPVHRAMFFSASGKDSDSSKTPAAQPETSVAEAAPPGRFVRTADATTAGGKSQNFAELFQAKPANTGSAITQAVFTAESAPGQKSLEDILQVDYEQPGDAPEGKIVQVRANAPSHAAQPFPGMEPAAAAPARHALNEPIATQPAAGSPFERQPARSNLTISRSTPQHAAPVAAAKTAPASNGPQTPSVTVEWISKSEINVGQQCRCELIVKNTGKSVNKNVQVEAYFPASVRLVSAAPEPAAGTDSLTWEFASLEPGESRTLEIAMIPLERGQIETRADVRFSSTATGTFAVSEPLLELAIEGPSQVLVGEPASHTVVVTNPGTGVATNVQVEALIPEGLEHARGKRLLMDLGSLNPGERRPVRLAMSAVSGGRHVIQVQARGDGSLVQTSAAEVLVIAPRLMAGVDGPGLRYVGRQGTYTLKVLNDGAAPTDNVRVMHKVPEGFSFVKADRGAQYDPATRILSWFAGRLEQGQSSEIHVTLSADKIGEFTHYVRATSEQGSVSDAQITTAVEGTSSLAIEVRDLDDPVEVGTEAVYEVKIRNEGSAAAKNVALACELAPGMSFVAAQGPAEHVSENGLVSFRTIPDLGPGQSATFQVRVSSTAAANLRFRARLSSESIAEPLTAEELTKFYGE